MFTYDGKSVEFISEDENFAYFNYGGKKVKVAKTAHWSQDDSRYIMTDDGMTYYDIEVEINDGEAIVLCCGSVELPNGEEDDTRCNDKFRMRFPKLKDILTNKKKFEQAMYYIEGIETSLDEDIKYNDGELSISNFFEGYFFGTDIKLERITDGDEDAPKEVKKKKFNVGCTIIYNGCAVVEAENEEEALRIVEESFTDENLKPFPDSAVVGDVSFRFGEATADYAEEDTY